MNDGSQRLRAAKWFRDNASNLGLTKDKVEEILENTVYHYTKKLYKSHREGLARFQFVNNNIQLTNYQITVGDLLYCLGPDNQEDVGKFIDKVHQVVTEVVNRMVIRENPDLEDEADPAATRRRHNLWRHNISLYLRFVSEEKEPRNYKPTSDAKIKTDLTSKKAYYFELELGKLISEIGLKVARDRLKLFRAALHRSAASIETAWKEIDPTGATEMHSTAFRWLLDVDIWRRNNDYSTEAWEKFVRQFLANTKGSSKIYYKDPKREQKLRSSNVKLSDVASIESICRYIESDFYAVVTNQPVRERRPRQKAGYDHSHVKPFSQFGEGETIAEPSSVNRARGAKPI